MIDPTDEAEIAAGQLCSLSVREMKPERKLNIIYAEFPNCRTPQRPF